MYRKRPNFIGIFFFFLIFGGSIVNVFFPLLIAGLLGYTFYKAISQAQDNKTNKTFEKKKIRSKYTERDLRKIDKKLRDYFKNNEILPIAEDVALKPKKGSYTNVSELYLYKDYEVIESLNEYGSHNRDIYDAIIGMLLEFSKHKASKLNQRDIDEYISKTEETVKNDKPEVQKGSRAREFIEVIDSLNEEIPNEEITNGLYETTSLLKHTEMIEKNYKGETALFHKLYDIYLPQLRLIMEKYKKLQDTSKGSEEFNKCQDQLIKSVILVNEAIKNINETLHEEDYMDISTDMTTLESLLKQDGMVDENNIRKFGGRK